jgi:hypothetical protein
MEIIVTLLGYYWDLKNKEDTNTFEIIAKEEIERVIKNSFLITLRIPFDCCELTLFFCININSDYKCGELTTTIEWHP